MHNFCDREFSIFARGNLVLRVIMFYIVIVIVIVVINVHNFVIAHIKTTFISNFCRSIAWFLACCVALPELTSIIRTPEVTIAISSERPKEAALKVCALFGARIEVCDRTIFDVFNFWCVFVGSIRLQ